MTIHVLNCGTMRPYFPPVENGVTCLLVETNQGPVFVDTGFGTRDYSSPTPAMKFFLKLMRAPRDVNETACYQARRLGYQPEDVQHIIQTHLHLDHAGLLISLMRRCTSCRKNMTISNLTAAGSIIPVTGRIDRIGFCIRCRENSGLVSMQLS